MTKKKQSEQVQELTADLQRLRADFENYRKRVEIEKNSLIDFTKTSTIMKLLPVIDNIERAIAHEPEELKDNVWVQGIITLNKNLEKSLEGLGLNRIESTPGTPFDPSLHEAVMMEESEGEHEVISEELRPGYKIGDQVMRPSMVKVTKSHEPKS